MERRLVLRDRDLQLPPGFFDAVIRDIPADTWFSLLEKDISLRNSVLEGISAHKLNDPAIFSQSRTITRLKSALAANRDLLDEVLNAWGIDHLDLLAFLEMLDRNFLIENLKDLKDFIGPERLFAGLHLLDFLQDEPVRNRIDKDFWNREITEESVELFVPVWSLLRDAVSQSPEIKRKLAEMVSASGGKPVDSTLEPAENRQEPSPSLRAHRRKVDQRIQNLENEKLQLQEQVTRYRRENEEFRKELDDWQRELETRVKEASAGSLREWFQRYGELDESPIEEAAGRLEVVLKHAERAFELQRQADEKYGLAAAVRQDLLRTELYLKEIERICTDSLFVHGEVEKAKEALLKERKRLLGLPGVQKILGREPEVSTEANLLRKIHLLEAVPSNLAKINSLHAIVNRLADLGFIEDPEPLFRDISRKKRQILEVLYASFPPAPNVTSRDQGFRNLDDFVRAGAGRKYDVFVDGYNILLNIPGETGKAPDASLAALRDDFINAVCRKSRSFRKIYLVFDGVEESREVRDNVEIIYADRKRGSSADTIIINAMKKLRDKAGLLVTADREIIAATEKWLYAVIDPLHFHMFVNDVKWPE